MCEEGGFEYITRKKKWSIVARKVKINDFSFGLKDSVRLKLLMLSVLLVIFGINNEC